MQASGLELSGIGQSKKGTSSAHFKSGKSWLSGIHRVVEFVWAVANWAMANNAGKNRNMLVKIIESLSNTSIPNEDHTPNGRFSRSNIIYLPKLGALIFGCALLRRLITDPLVSVGGCGMGLVRCRQRQGPQYLRQVARSEAEQLERNGFRWDWYSFQIQTENIFDYFLFISHQNHLHRIFLVWCCIIPCCIFLIKLFLVSAFCGAF